MARSGQYRARVTIQEIPQTTDTDGGLIDGSPITHAIRMAKVETPSGSEKYRFDQMQVAITHKVTLRTYLSTVTAKMIVSWGSRTLQIKSVLHDEMKHRWTVLWCEEQS